jgi:hypothetical protein
MRGVASGTGGAGANNSRGKGKGAMQARINQEGDRATQLKIIIRRLLGSSVSSDTDTDSEYFILDYFLQQVGTECPSEGGFILL